MSIAPYELEYIVKIIRKSMSRYARKVTLHSTVSLYTKKKLRKETEPLMKTTFCVRFTNIIIYTKYIVDFMGQCMWYTAPHSLC